MNTSTQQASSDERLLAALAQLSVVLPFVGFLVPLHIWLTSREWSRCVQHHALQALFWQLVSSGLTLAYGVIVVAGIYGSLAVGAESPLGPGMVALRCILFLLGAGGYAFAVFAGIRAARKIRAGFDHIYPVVGDWIANHNA